MKNCLLEQGHLTGGYMTEENASPYPPKEPINYNNSEGQGLVSISSLHDGMSTSLILHRFCVDTGG